jgi:hypothetical protein
MSQDTENFEQLRRLLKLKRYEQPHPRYFNDFSSQVITRIKLGERGEDTTLAGWVFWDAPWLQRIWGAFEASPIMAGAVGLAICATLVTGVIYSERTDLQPLALIPGADSPIAGSMDLANAVATDQSFLATPAVFQPSSTNGPSELPIQDAFLGSLHAQPADFTFPTGN